MVAGGRSRRGGGGARYVAHPRHRPRPRAVLLVAVFYGACTARVRPNEWGVEQRKFGFKRGIVDRAYGAGLYFVGPGATMHTFPREIHLLEASYDRQEAEERAGAWASTS